MNKDISHYKQIFSSARSKARRAGVSWNLSFDEWLEWWGKDLDKMGRGQNDLRMVRISESEPFSLENLRKVDAIQLGKILSSRHRNKACSAYSDENIFRKDAMVYSPSKDDDDDSTDGNEPLFDRSMVKMSAFVIDKRR